MATSLQLQIRTKNPKAPSSSAMAKRTTVTSSTKPTPANVTSTNLTKMAAANSIDSAHDRHNEAGLQAASTSRSLIIPAESVVPTNKTAVPSKIVTSRSGKSIIVGSLRCFFKGPRAIPMKTIARVPCSNRFAPLEKLIKEEVKAAKAKKTSIADFVALDVHEPRVFRKFKSVKSRSVELVETHDAFKLVGLSDEADNVQAPVVKSPEARKIGLFAVVQASKSYDFGTATGACGRSYFDSVPEALRSYVSKVVSEKLNSSYNSPPTVLSVNMVSLSEETPVNREEAARARQERLNRRNQARESRVPSQGATTDTDEDQASRHGDDDDDDFLNMSEEYNNEEEHVNPRRNTEDEKDRIIRELQRELAQLKKASAQSKPQEPNPQVNAQTTAQAQCYPNMPYPFPFNMPYPMPGYPNPYMPPMPEGENSSSEWPHPYVRKWGSYNFGFMVDPKFHTFSGIGNPDEHLAHFIAMCGQYGTYDAYLLQKFSLSLTGEAFSWYADLPKDSIPDWKEMKKQFKDNFYNTESETKLADLMGLEQRANEPPQAYVNRCKEAIRRCKHKIPQNEAVQMCKRGFTSDIAWQLNMLKSDTFQELEGHIKDTTSFTERIGGCPMFPFGPHNPNKTQKKDQRKTSEVCTILTSQDRRENRKQTFKEAMSKPYSFRKDKTKQIFEQLVKADLVPIPPAKKPHEAALKSDPNYCPYHQMLGHTIEDCVTFKDIVERMLGSKEVRLPPNQTLNPPVPHELPPRKAKAANNISCNMISLHHVSDSEYHDIISTDTPRSTINRINDYSSFVSLPFPSMIEKAKSDLSSAVTYQDLQHIAKEIFTYAKENEDAHRSENLHKKLIKPKGKLAFKEFMRKPYSFPKDKVKLIFTRLLGSGLLYLPLSKRPSERCAFSHPQFCNYHRFIGHKTEDCATLKDEIERMIQEGSFELSDEYRIHPPQPHELPPC